MIKFFKSWKAIGTCKYSYTINKTDIFIVSVTFYIGKNESRKIKLDYDKKLSKLYSPISHPFYHNMCIPFLKKTGEFAANNEESARMIKILSDSQISKEVKILKQMSLKKEGNVVFFHKPKENNE